MTIQPIGAASVALFLTHDDLREHGLRPDDFNLELALELSRNAFRQTGMPGEGALEIEAYPDAWGILVFARMEAPQRLWFQFAQPDALLRAARGVSDDCTDVSMALWEGQYWLSVPADAQKVAGQLSERGSKSEIAPFFAAPLGEHGLTILPSCALAVLLQHVLP